MTPNDKLPEETSDLIKSNAKAYAATLQLPKDWPESRVDGAIEDAVNDYIAGATAWEQWKVKHDELLATIDDKIDKAIHAERYKMQAKITVSEVGWAMEYQELKKVLQEFVSNHEAGLLPNRFVYEKAIKILNDGN